MTEIQALREQIGSLETERDEWIATAHQQTEMFVSACHELSRLSSISFDEWLLKFKASPDSETSALKRQIETLSDKVAKARLESEDLRGELETLRALRASEDSK